MAPQFQQQLVSKMYQTKIIQVPVQLLRRLYKKMTTQMRVPQFI